MATGFIPSLMRKLTDDRDRVEVPGKTLREVVNNLDEAYPGIEDLIAAARAPACSSPSMACSPRRG